jgi:signal transduction histidine kinase
MRLLIKFHSVEKKSERSREESLEAQERRRLEEQSRQAQKMEAVGRMAEGLAHDLNNRLSAINNNAFILRGLLKDEEQLARINKIIAAAENAAALMHSLLAFSRKKVLNPRPLDINETIVHSVDFLKRALPESIEIKTSIQERPLVVTADANQIENAVVSLAMNARDSMPGGGRLIISSRAVDLDDFQARLHGLEKGGPYALIQVSDTGAGMDETARRRIFEPFSITGRHGRGAGLGLAMVYSAVRQHGGGITVQSEPGKGTSFHILLPLTDEDVAEVEESAAGPRGGTETILFAEDDPEVRSTARFLLEHFGYRVVEGETPSISSGKARAGSTCSSSMSSCRT